MNQEKLARFLYFFYKGYLKKCFLDAEAFLQNDKELALQDYDLGGFLLKHVDIYVQHTEMQKDYEKLYNTKLFYGKKQSDPELFNELELFFIENFQLFCHSIAKAVLEKKHPDLARLKLQFRPIDNVAVSLLDLVEDAENS